MNHQRKVDIVLVEDNPQDAELTVRALKKNNIHNECVGLTDGAEALDYIFCKGKFVHRDFSNNPKVILLDLKLPKVNGLEVLKTIKLDTRTSSIPVVILSSSQQDADITMAYKYGANSYVVKPLDFTSFTEAIKQLGLYWMLVNKAPNN